MIDIGIVPDCVSGRAFLVHRPVNNGAQTVLDGGAVARCVKRLAHEIVERDHEGGELALVDRGERELPIKADFVGKNVSALHGQPCSHDLACRGQHLNQRRSSRSSIDKRSPQVPP